MRYSKQVKMVNISGLQPSAHKLMLVHRCKRWKTPIYHPDYNYECMAQYAGQVLVHRCKMLKNSDLYQKVWKHLCWQRFSKKMNPHLC